jgi:hypothetical protein
MERTRERGNLRSVRPMRTFLTALLGLVIIASLLALDNYLFQRWLGLSHWQWYLANGGLISAGLAIFSIAWGDLNKHTGLISAHPLDYLGSQLQLVGLPLVSFGAQFRSAPGDRYRPSLLDTLLSIPLVLLLIVFCFVYLLVIVPPQYLVFLLCGAPARVIAASSRKVAARMQGGQVMVEELQGDQKEPENWWNAGMNQKPVTITTLFSVLFFITLKIFIP